VEDEDDEGALREQPHQQLHISTPGAGGGDESPSEELFHSPAGVMPTHTHTHTLLAEGARDQDSSLMNEHIARGNNLFSRQMDISGGEMFLDDDEEEEED
jgi:hypothetical protein